MTPTRLTICAAALMLLSAASASAEPAYVTSTVNLRSGARAPPTRSSRKIPGGSLVDATNCTRMVRGRMAGQEGLCDRDRRSTAAAACRRPRCGTRARLLRLRAVEVDDRLRAGRAAGRSTARPGPYYYGYGYRPYYGYRYGYGSTAIGGYRRWYRPLVSGTRMRAIIASRWPASLGATLRGAPAAALDYPTRPVHVIMPFTAGGAPDVLMRLLGQKLAEKWGQGVVVENRAGGNTLIGTVAGAKSAPDGYTLTARRRSDLRAQSAALQLAALFDEGVRADRADGVDPAHARGRQQGAGVERQGADRAGQGRSPTPSPTAPPAPAPSSASPPNISPASPASSSSRCPTRAPTKPPPRSWPARST